MGWCRGKLSEGIDFADNLSRLVVIIGIPHPNISAADVVLRKKFLDQRPIGNFNGDAWYK